MTATKPSPPPDGPGHRQTPSRARTGSQASSHTRTPVRSLTDPSSPKSVTPPRPAGPRSPDISRSAKARSERPGSSRTKFVTTFPADVVGPATPPLTSSDSTSPSTSTAFPPQPDIPDEVDASHPPYRPPEPVFDPTEEPLPDYIEAVVEEHPISDDEMLEPELSPSENRGGKTRVDAWQANLRQYNMMDTDEDYDKGIERPQIGPGNMPRRLLALVHEHELLQPVIKVLPERGPKKSQALTSSLSGPSTISASSKSAPVPLTPATSNPGTAAPETTTQATTPPEYDRISTMNDLWAACPGGAGERREWYFCPLCWFWFRISCGSGGDPEIATMEEWQNSDLSETTPERQNERVRAMGRHRDIITSRSLGSRGDHHFHELNSLIEPSEDHRLERVKLGQEMNCFPHATLSWGDDQDWASGGKPRSTRLHLSCSSVTWLVVDGPVAGQLPAKLVNAFTAEKMSNPGPSGLGADSVNEAWELLSTLLVNPLFKDQRGWVKMDNKRFQSKIGASLTTSRLLYEIGFACRQDEDVLRVGPLIPNDTISLQQVEQMDRYMLRTWVEISLFLLQFRSRNHLIPDVPGSVTAIRLEDSSDKYLDLPLYPRTLNPLPDTLRDACYDLGVTKNDIASTIEAAYELQIACDTSNIPKYLQALESISRAPNPGKEALQLKVATERSLNRNTINDIRAAYDDIGYTVEHASRLGVEPEDAPEDYLLQLHKNATAASTNAVERTRLARALTLIGNTRNSELMTQLGGSGQTFLSLEEAYRSLSAPRDSVDDGLILQYEMAVGEFPGKIEHYRMCLDIIANANGEERSALKTYLETGSKGAEAPVRLDIPVGLQNIGNTCYLNSILQYLYSIKPLREAVMAFDETTASRAKSEKPDVVRSRRFVQQLRDLFLQLYNSETSSVRPEEELAYLAVTRPEVDEIVQPSITVVTTLDSIPNIPSPSSTIVNTSPEPEETSLPPSSLASPRTGRSRSVLGKRASEDREEASLSGDDRQRLKSEGFEHIEEADFGMEVDRPEEDFDVGSHSKSVLRRQRAISPSAASDLAGLDLQSPREGTPCRQASPTVIEPIHELASVPPPLPPRPSVPNRKDSLAAGLRFGLQQDSAEVLINVLNQLELAFDPVNGSDGDDKASNLIRDLYSCSFQQQNTYLSSDGTVETPPPKQTGFSHPIIGVEEEGKNLYDCLGELYLLASEVEYEGKTGYTMDLMDTFPPMLYIQMRRSQYDPVTRRESKTNTHIAFQQTLSMDRFLVNVDPAKREKSIAITRDMARVRARLQRLKYNKPMAIPLTFQHVRESLGLLQSEHDLDITQDFLEALGAEEKELTAEIIRLEDSLPVLKRGLESLWEDAREHEYELVSVFMHRGKTSGAGHYWTYQSHLPTDPERFFKYNDETVTPVPASEVLQDRTGSDANPALLCYVRKGMDMVDTLHRRVLEADAIVPQMERLDEG